MTVYRLRGRREVRWDHENSEFGKTKVANESSFIGAAWLAFLAAPALLFVFLDRPFLPAKYAFDEEKIQLIAQGYAGYSEDKSFQLVGDIYGALGMGFNPVAARLFGFCAFMTVLIVAVGYRRSKFLRVLCALLVAGAAAIAAVYLGAYSKDMFVLPISLVAVLALRHSGRHADLLLLASMLCYAYLFRTYWFLICGFFMVVRWGLNRRRPVSSLLIVSVVVMTLVAVASEIFLGVPLDQYRSEINESRSSDFATTAITGITPSASALTSVVNSIYIFLMFLVPLPLFFSGGVQHVVAGGFLVTMWVALFGAGRKVNSLYPENKNLDGARRALSLIIGVLLVQSIFEPDYGSFLRHFAPLLPVVIATLLEVDRERRKVPAICAH